jgi:hypothetical protein
MDIVDVKELDNNDVAILCEQQYTYIYKTQWYTTYTRHRGSVVTAFVSPNGSIDDISIMKKHHLNQVTRYLSAKEMCVSITPFVYGNKVGYIFNKLIVKKKKDENDLLDNNGNNAIITMNMQNNGNEIETIDLSGSGAAKRLFRELLFVEKDRLIILTQTEKKAFIETITFE